MEESAKEFEPIETQEQLDSIVKDRIKREKESASKKFAEYDEKIGSYEAEIGSLGKSLDEAKKKIDAYDAEKGELEKKILAYERSALKAKAAREYGIPDELAERLEGETEEAVMEDAKRLSQFVAKRSAAPPLKDTETNAGDAKDAALLQMLREMKK